MSTLYPNHLNILLFLISHLSTTLAFPIISRAKNDDEEGMIDEYQKRAGNWCDQNPGNCESIGGLVLLVFAIAIFVIYYKVRRRRKAKKAKKEKEEREKLDLEKKKKEEEERTEKLRTAASEHLVGQIMKEQKEGK